MELKDKKEEMYVTPEMIAKVQVKTNPIVGLVLSVIFGLIGAVIWAVVTKVTGYNLGIIAILVGFLVSQGFVIAGRSNQVIWGVLAAGVTIVSMLLGKILIIVFFVSDELGLTVLDVLSLLDFESIKYFLTESFEIFDLVFYAIAISTAFKRSYAEEFVVDEFAPGYQAPVMSESHENEIPITQMNTDTVKIPVTYITPETETQENFSQEG